MPRNPGRNSSLEGGGGGVEARLGKVSLVFNVLKA
jgi:hypothetical protein